MLANRKKITEGIQEINNGLNKVVPIITDCNKKDKETIAKMQGQINQIFTMLKEDATDVEEAYKKLVDSYNGLQGLINSNGSSLPGVPQITIPQAGGLPIQLPNPIVSGAGGGASGLPGTPVYSPNPTSGGAGLTGDDKANPEPTGGSPYVFDGKGIEEILKNGYAVFEGFHNDFFENKDISKYNGTLDQALIMYKLAVRGIKEGVKGVNGTALKIEKQDLEDLLNNGNYANPDEVYTKIKIINNGLEPNKQLDEEGVKSLGNMVYTLKNAKKKLTKTKEWLQEINHDLEKKGYIQPAAAAT